MRVNISESDQLTPGITLSATKIHSLVDNTTIDNLASSEITISGPVMAATPVSGAWAYLTHIDNEVMMYPRTEVSLINGGMRNLLGKTYLAYYHNENGHKPYKGLPCFVPIHADASRGSWDGWNSSPASMSDWQWLPRISMDQIRWSRWHSEWIGGVRETSIAFLRLWGVVDETLDATEGIVKVVEHGFCQALVEETRSNEISQPSVYAIQYESGDETWFPAAVNPTDISTLTVMNMPLGLIRKVYTESGTTAVPFVLESEASATNVNYYVAEVFFGGFPTL